MDPNYGENQQNSPEEPNLFGTISSIGFQMYGYVLAQNAGRAASNYKRMYDAHNPVEPKTKSSYSGHRSEYSSFSDMSPEKKSKVYENKSRKSAAKYKKYDRKYQESFEKGEYKRGARNYARRSDAKADFKKYRRASNSYRPTDISSQMKVSHHVSSGEVQKLDDVFLHINFPFTGRLDKGGLGSVSKAYNGLKASDDIIVSAFKNNNHHFFSQLENFGFSKDEIKKLKDFASLSNKDSYFKTYSGASEYIKDSDNVVENILFSKKKYISSNSKKTTTEASESVVETTSKKARKRPFKKNVDFDEIRGILNKTDDSGELLIKKVSPNINQTSTKGVGFAFNLTKFAEKMPTLSKYLFTGARVAAGVADGLVVYDLVKTTGEIAVNTYKNTDSYKDTEDKKFMTRNHIKSYDQMASFEDTVLSSRISSNQTIQEEKALIQSALSAKANVNEVLRQSIGGYSVNELSVNKVRKSGR